MLAIRLKRTGRSGHSQFRVVVQDSHFHPTRGRVVAYLGSYDPHTKSAQIDTEAATKYLSNGAQPSERVARLLKSQGVELPKWVKLADPKERTIRNPEKLRRNRPAEEAAPAAADEPAPESSVETAEEPSEAPAESPEAPAEEPSAEPEVAAEPEASGEAVKAANEPEAPAQA